MKNIFLVPTDKPSRLRIGNNGNFVLGLVQSATPSKNDSFTNQHIYITSDEEIKEGDFFYVKTPNIHQGNIVTKCLNLGKGCWSGHILTDTTDEKGYHPSHCEKIILTTDQDLIGNGIQAIDDEFLEWFVNNPSCESVKVNQEFNPKNMVYGINTNPYKIIIPKEEMKLDALKLIVESYGFELVEKKREIKVGDFGKFWDNGENNCCYDFLKTIDIDDVRTPYKTKFGTWYNNFSHLTDEEKQQIQENW